MSTEASLSSLAASFSTSLTSDHTTEDHNAEYNLQNKRHYLRALHQVIEQSDVVVLVLDARDPEGCRSRLIEEEVRRRESEGKRLVFVLNKVGKWLSNLFHDPF